MAGLVAMRDFYFVPTMVDKLGPRKPSAQKKAINDIYFRDKEAGFLIAGNTIFVTHDNGTVWQISRSFLPAEFDGAEVELYSVRFSSKKKGWVVGSVSRGDRVIDVRIGVDIVQPHPNAKFTQGTHQLGHTGFERPALPEAGAVFNDDAISARVL